MYTTFGGTKINQHLSCHCTFNFIPFFVCQNPVILNWHVFGSHGTLLKNKNVSITKMNQSKQIKSFHKIGFMIWLCKQFPNLMWREGISLGEIKCLVQLVHIKFNLNPLFHSRVYLHQWRQGFNIKYHMKTFVLVGNKLKAGILIYLYNVWYIFWGFGFLSQSMLILYHWN